MITRPGALAEHSVLRNQKTSGSGAVEIRLRPWCLAQYSTASAWDAREWPLMPGRIMATPPLKVKLTPLGWAGNWMAEKRCRMPSSTLRAQPIGVVVQACEAVTDHSWHPAVCPYPVPQTGKRLPACGCPLPARCLIVHRQGRCAAAWPRAAGTIASTCGRTVDSKA